MSGATCEDELKRTAIRVLRQSRERIEKCLAHIDNAGLWQDFNPHLVSIGNLVLHLIGNISQHVLSGLGQDPYTRHRSTEFTAKPGTSKAALLAEFDRVMHRAVEVVERLQPGDLLKRSVFQGHECTAAEDLMSVAEHLSYHTGQIVFAVKYAKNIDLGFYAGVDLNQQNRPAGPTP